MTVSEARTVLKQNVIGNKGSLTYALHESEIFSEKLFWEFYDCVITLAKDALTNGRDIGTARDITWAYQWVLKSMIWHFDKNDCFHLSDFPINYPEYFERLDGAMDAYFRGVFADEAAYSLQRSDSG